jgi:RimJ/RimL family protein N-acetyltransferase
MSSSGTHVVPALPGIHPWLPVPYAATQADVICLFQRADLSIVRVHESPSRAVKRLLERLPSREPVQPDLISVFSEGEVNSYLPDLFFYLERTSFQPVSSANVRVLGSREVEAFNQLHAAIDLRQRWYVELDHPIVLGLFSDDRLVAVASHFLFEDFGIAAPGVLTHPDYRRRGYGTAVVSAAVAWALERELIIEWSTNESNLGSLAIAHRLGFQPFALETEFRIGEP